MAFLTLFVGTLAILACWSLPIAAEDTSYVTVEKLTHVPDGWIQDQTPPPSTIINFHIAVHQENAAEFEQKVIDISTPGHPHYGQHVKRDEVRDLVRPSDGIVDAVLFWLQSEQVPTYSLQHHGNWIAFTIPVSKAEAMMKTKFYQFTNIKTGTRVIRTLSYSVPQEIYPYIQLIQPTTRFGHPSAQANLQRLRPVAATAEDLAAGCHSMITPDCLRELYGIFDTKAKPDPRNRLGISGYLDQYARYSDLEAFMKRYAPNRTDTNFTVVSINGGLNLQNSTQTSSEASLDVQYAVSLAYSPLATYYTTAGRGPVVGDEVSTNEPYLEQLRYLLDLPDEELPAVLSTSYGEDEQSVPESYSNATCNLFAQLGARGVSVIFSSGDSGVGGTCQTNDGTNTTRFQPIFPASCPFVTSVGGTFGLKPEKAIDFSGGGFSERFPRPSYQDRSVNKYLEGLGDRWDGLYNRNGRGIPDVAAQASNFVIVDHGSFASIGGTSAAAPVFAAVISRINAARLEDGKPRMGFLNPWLYSLNQTGFTDIVDGGSEGCSDEGGSPVPYASWNATQGWDPVTGLGTPFYNTLVKVARNI